MNPISARSSERRKFLSRISGALAAVAAFLPSQLLSKPKTSAAASIDILDAVYIGEIRAFPFDFAPSGWMKCEGQLMQINVNQALFSLLGTTYGGNGQTNFALPDLRGRMPMHATDNDELGSTGGEATHILTIAEMPSHNHTLNGAPSVGTSASPVNNVPAVGAEGMKLYASTINGQMESGTISNTGSSQPHDNMPPYLVLQYCIAIEGTFPSET